MKYNTKIFIKKAVGVHKRRYDYSLVDYVNSRTNVKIICKKHGEFLQNPSNHLIGNGCKKCHNNRISLDVFIGRSNIVHDFYYDYSEVNYEGYYNPITIICPKHGKFLQKPDSHLAGKGCQFCSGRKQNTKIFIEKAIKIHENRYDYSKVNYIHNKTKVLILCKTHGEFLQNTSEHLRGKGCPKCSMSKGESLIKNFLEKNKIDFIYQKIFDNCKYITNLRFDFYLPEKNTLIEFDGIQHYKVFDYFGGEKIFEETRIKDEIKNQYARDNNILLRRISYIDLNNSTLKNILNDILN